MANKNKALGEAKAGKKDEFYTQLSDIEKERRHYRPHFAGKTVLCNCDDPFESNFFKYFVLNFNRLGLKKLIATCYASSSIAGRQLRYEVDKTGQMNFYFRSAECVELLKEADIVVTNPPFSLFREYVATLMAHDKKFIIIGKTMDIPMDYDGMMGVPITFMEHFNPDQFELIGTSTGELGRSIGVKPNYCGRTDISFMGVDGKPKCPFQRFIIRNKHPEPPRGKCHTD